MINLLPKEEIEKLKEEESFRVFLNLFFLFFFFFLSIFLILSLIKIHFSGILEAQKILLSKEEKILDLEKEKEIKEYNQILSKLDSFYKEKIFLFPKIEEFFEKIPSQISLRSLEISLDKKREISVSFFGFSKNRKELLNLIERLKENYKSTSFSPEILLKENEIDFSISFKIK